MEFGAVSHGGILDKKLAKTSDEQLDFCFFHPCRFLSGEPNHQYPEAQETGNSRPGAVVESGLLIGTMDPLGWSDGLAHHGY